MSLLVRITGRDGEHELSVTRDQTDHEELTRFLNRQGPYALTWVRLSSGEYVRYDHFVSVRIDD
jgi:hypothetical protein